MNIAKTPVIRTPVIARLDWSELNITVFMALQTDQ
jgi:hypothetical protein